MFAGIGGFRAGLERAGGFECIGHCEIDKHADRAYRAVHKIKESEIYYEDATKINANTMPKFDLLCAGFPCQSFSIAGRRAGFADPRGTMFFEIARLVKARRPAYLLLENVIGLLSHDEGRTFGTILKTLCELRYHVEFQVINSKDHGVPQSRRRVYIVGYLNQRCAGKILPLRGTNEKTLVQILGGRQDSRVYDPDGLAKTLLAKSGGMGGKTGLYFIDLNPNPKITSQARCIKSRYDCGITKRKGENSGVMYPVGFNRKDGITKKLDTAYTILASDFRGLNRNNTQNAVLVANTTHSAHAVLTPERENVRQNGRRIKDAEEPMFTLTSQDKHGVLLIKEATKRGFKEASPGDSVDLAFAGQNTRRGRVGKSIANTLDTGSSQGVVTLTGRIRRLMPRECLRLQGFDENQIDKILSVGSDAQAYKQAGNGYDVLRKWGFTPRSIFIWIKPRMGLGVYLRNCAEFVLLGTKGKAPIQFKAQMNWLFAPIQSHSHKPEEFMEIVRRCSPGPYLELFARRRHSSDWDVWGNEIESDVVIKGYPVPRYSKKATESEAV